MGSVVKAIFKRDLRRWFGSPTGYVFIVLFVLLAAAALFWPYEFFQSNLANLDTLNTWFPLLLLFFIPAVTMNLWAGERGQGTDELLLTLPATDTQIIAGKFLAAAGVYTLALLFCLPLIIFLSLLGNPDWGLMFSNFLGYWLLGLLLISAGMVGSQLSDNLTIAFILGALVCAAVIAFESILRYLAPNLAYSWTGFGPVSLFSELTRGIISLASILLFLGLIIGFLYLNRLLLTRRHWRPNRGEGVHLSLRFVSLVIAVVALTAMGANFGSRADLTVERIHSLSQETRDLLRNLAKDRPVYIQAYVSTEVPREYVQTRRTLLNLLAEYDALAGELVQVRVVDTKRYSDEAREAESKFGIEHATRLSEEEGRVKTYDFYLGLAFTSGLEEVVVPFLDKGLPVEYELTRSIRVVSSSQRQKVGILDTDVKLFGGFDFQSMRQDPEWSIVKELKLQYDVQRVDPSAEYPSDLQALIVLLPSSLTQEQLNRLEQYVLQGQATLLIDDPFPVSSPGNSPTDPKGGPQNPMMGRQQSPEQKGNVRAFLEKINIGWPYTSIIWDAYNPHPQYSFEPELVFLGGGGEKTHGGFNQTDSVTSGLQEMVALFAGYVERGEQDNLNFTPLLATSSLSGSLPKTQVFSSNFFGGQSLNPARQHRPDNQAKTLACRITSKATNENNVNVIFVSDVDMFSEQFFQLRKQGFEEFNFDNVTFLLNAVDSLAKDESFIELRKRRPQHRTLQTIEEKESAFAYAWLQKKQEAETKAEEKLAEAEARLKEKVEAVKQRQDLDEQSKAIQIKSIEEVEQRRFEVSKAAIEDEKNQRIEVAKAEMLREQDSIRDWYRFWALIISPLPAILFGGISVIRRRNREQESTQSTQSSGGAA